MTDSPVLDQHPLADRSESVPERGLLARGPLVTLDWRQAAGFALILAGVIAVVIAWWGVSGTLDPGKQMPYLASGGFGGAAAVAVGVMLLISYEHARDRAALATILRRLDDIESRLPTTITANGGTATGQPSSADVPTRKKRAAR